MPKFRKYAKITDFMLSQDFGYVTYILSEGNYLVFYPTLAETFFLKPHTPGNVKKLASLEEILPS